MIDEGREFSEYIRNDLFLQKVDDRSRDSVQRRLAGLYCTTGARRVDVGFAHDTFWQFTDAQVRTAMAQCGAERFVISEATSDFRRGIMAYSSIAAEAGYRLHRIKHIPFSGGEIVILEFHRKEHGNAA